MSLEGVTHVDSVRYVLCANCDPMCSVYDTYVNRGLSLVS